MQENGSIFYLGHASLRIRTKEGKVIYIDPYAGSDYDMEADLILSTHGHKDHSMVERVPAREGCVTITHQEALVDGRYLDTEAHGISVKAAPAYNEKHARDMGVGYILGFDGIRVYIAGDTSKIDEMGDLAAMDITYAFLPCDGFFNMDAREASECAEIIRAKHSIPYHTCRNTEGDYSPANAEEFRCEGRLLLRPSESISYLS